MDDLHTVMDGRADARLGLPVAQSADAMFTRARDYQAGLIRSGAMIICNVSHYELSATMMPFGR